VTRAIVISPDPNALTFAGSLDPRVWPVQQQRDQPGLLAALDQARSAAMADGAGTLLVIFGDLPLLDAADVHNLLRRDAPVVIAPDWHGEGTNALLLRPNANEPGEHGFQFQFGDGSFGRHVAEAHRLGLDVATTSTTGTAFDLDTPADLIELERRQAGPLSGLLAEAVG
jgi:2-phospho-L-lactate guanylyltransferase